MRSKWRRSESGLLVPENRPHVRFARRRDMFTVGPTLLAAPTGGSAVGFPVVESTSTGGSSSTAAQSITMPSGVTNGDLLLVLFSNDGSAPTSITGSFWTQLIQANNTVNSHVLTVYWKIADGTDSLTVNFSTDQCEYVAYRISGTSGCTAVASVTSSKDFPSITPIEGSAKWLWVIGWGLHQDQTVTSAPSGYSSNLVNVSASGSGAGIAASYRTNEASSEDPGSFTTSGGAGTDALAVIAVAPTAAYSDANYSSVVSVINPSGADGSTSITDAKGKTWTANGNAQVDTGVLIFGQPTLLFDGSGDMFTSPDSADWNPGSGDFTVEAWAYPTSDPTAEAAFISQWGSGTDLGWLFGRATSAASRRIAFYYRTNGGTNSFNTSNTTISSNALTFCSFSRIGNTGYFHYNGIQDGTISLTGITFNDCTASAAIGAVAAAAGAPFTGNLGPIRFTKGVGRYGASNYPLPARPFATS